jgi:signal transduction histidine kinase/CheY-like chemotaxis protein
MTEPSPNTDPPDTGPKPRGRLFHKYVGLFVAVVSLALITSGLLEIWFSYYEQRAMLIRVQRGQAELVSQRISQFIHQIDNQLKWAARLPWSADTLDEWRLDAARLLQQVPAVSEIAQLDGSGRERARISRQSVDTLGSQADFSQDPAFRQARQNKVYYGPVYFLRDSEPYMTLAVAGARPEYGVMLAQINLKFIWDVVSQVTIGNSAITYVIDARGRLIAHPDISLVLRNIRYPGFAQLQDDRLAEPVPSQPWPEVNQGHEVFSAYAPVRPLGWRVFVDLPLKQAYAPLYASIWRSAGLLVAALVLAAFAGLFLARRMVVPIQALRDGAARIGAGDLSQRLSIRTGDELEALSEQFNSMVARLQDFYQTLERKVDERTHQLNLANLAKSRFLASASHDLRQPLHALGLFIGQLRTRMNADERARVVDRVEAALGHMNELFDALLDISKLDSGVLVPNKTEFPVAQLLRRVETTFGGAAQEKKLKLKIVPSGAWVHSDYILLERILFNLVSNAVRYTARGRIVVGCRRRGSLLHIDVCDTGPGIPASERENIFGEFYRLNETQRDSSAGLGLGLAIVERLCRLLGHRIAVTSVEGKGSRFTVEVPLAVTRTETAERPSAARALPAQGFNGELVFVIDDDPLVRDGMAGLFRSWGCRVAVGSSDMVSVDGLAKHPERPDLIVSDFRLPHGKTGIDIIEALRGAYSAPIPAFLISGDTNTEPLREAQARGLQLLHKPITPMALRAMFNQILKAKNEVRVQ